MARGAAGTFDEGFDRGDPQSARRIGDQPGDREVHAFEGEGATWPNSPLETVRSRRSWRTGRARQSFFSEGGAAGSHRRKARLHQADLPQELQGPAATGPGTSHGGRRRLRRPARSHRRRGRVPRRPRSSVPHRLVRVPRRERGRQELDPRGHCPRSHGGEALPRAGRFEDDLAVEAGPRLPE